jgi:NodT family efflux transporter outer membrane factor (OMF) lipoprotein
MKSHNDLRSRKMSAHNYRTALRAAILVFFATLAGCTVGPNYVRPSVATPANFKEGVDWKIAEPQDEIARGQWWTLYGNAYLNSLVEQVAISNQNIKIAAAQYRQAQALIQQSQAGLFPTLSADVSASRGQGASNNTTTRGTTSTDRVSLNASWELDLWGGIRRTIEANESSAQASAADLQSALLSAQAAVVQAYLQLRVNEAQARLLQQTATAYARSQTITQNRYAAGVAARLDVAQADTQLNSTRAQLLDLGVQHAQLEHAIAILLGKPPAEFTLAASTGVPAVPRIPLDLPSALLERRPDIAAAERRVAAANAQIGVAQAAFFPRLTLSASGGYQGSSFANLFTLPNRFWSLSPALAATLFDAGAHSAQKQQAIAAFDKSVAIYRQTVLTGFQEVEDNLAALRILEQEAEVQDQAARSAAQSATIVNNQYQAGIVSYLNVVIAQATSLSAERSSLDLASRRLVASVALLKAMGGGWNTNALK